MAAEANPGGFGSILKAAREQRGLSLRDIAAATKISVNVLEALERNDIARLPGGIFSRAFVRAYAIQVGLDPDATIQEFIAQFPQASIAAGPVGAEQHEAEESHESNREAASAFVRLATISLPIVAAVVYFSTRGGSLPAPPPATAPLRAELPVESAPAPVPEPLTESTAARAAEVAPSPDERITVGLVATGPCWVSAVVDGERIVARELKVGERVTFDVARDLVLNVGDAAALAVTLNGAEARPLGGAGQVVTVRMTPTNFKEYLASP